MHKTLTGQLIIVFSLLFTVMAVGLYHWYLYTSQHYSAEVRQQLHSELAKHIVDDDSNLSQGIIDKKSLKSAFHTQMLLGPEWEFYALSPNGTVLAYSAPDNSVKLDQVSLNPIHDYLSGDNFPIYGQDPRNPERNNVFSVSEVYTKKGQLKGYLYVIIGGQKRANAEQNLVINSHFKNSLAIILGVLLFAVFTGFIVIRAIVKPLSELAKNSKNYINNDFNNSEFTKSHNHTASEIRDLENSFKSAAQHINLQLRQIKTTEQQRRELLSHVSHDLRTPLTALNGYLETWLISPETNKSDVLIENALRNAQQLNTLVEQLFELALLETGQISFTPETFNICELAHDITQRLKNQANQKNIDLKFVPESESLPLVVADIAKLERILVNLIDNALRHTPANGQVVLALYKHSNSVGVSVEDTGKGIPNHELASIFDRSFQASNSSKTQLNVGLGLTIVKHLLNLHHTEINVSSQQGTGSQFSFVLPSAT
ncbi:sensor histidine kinase [Saccharobesus litoralis]|uniref:histidine kinase n=1 Tax=Saccharobesus litoralis TaxID=2172099 RepID=A0A2S0VXU2_9ALTE|nr:HAMP domain-containing sensor histidine kinase [Saccharobesus litoralis]AWB69034.1 sensor histidine kinase [Saccharobesus litoralis]